jgi:hypothetical protein
VDKLVEIKFGSHLYGTNTPASDLDYKVVYLPSAKEILLQRVRNNITIRPNEDHGVRNQPGDVDREFISLQRYLELLAEGQTMALDMLFAPDDMMLIDPSPIWREIQANSHLLVSKKATSFIRYCRQQADKYGMKGARLAVVRQALELLQAGEDKYGTTARLSIMEQELLAFVVKTDQTTFVDRTTPSGQVIRHFQVCGKASPFTSTIKAAREMVQNMVDDYGNRAIQAEKNEGVDWRALSHAVRVGYEAIELFSSGHIHFPLAAASELLAIKRGEVPYKTVAARIDALLSQVEEVAATSTLREEPDYDFMDDLVERAYRGQILTEPSKVTPSPGYTR